MAYSTRYKVNPYLATLGAGKGIAKAGQVLVNLGNDKIATSKADALKKEKTAKELALGNATNAKNRVLNPNAVEKMNKIYGIKNGSLLDMPGTPTKTNANLNLVDFGKQDKPDKIKVKPDYTVDNVRYSGVTNKPIAITPRAKKTYKPTTPTVVQSYIGQDGYKYTLTSDNKTHKSQFKVRQQVSSSAKKANIVDVNSLTPSQAHSAQNNGLTYRNKNGIVVVDVSKIPTKPVKGLARNVKIQIGNIKVK